MTTRKAITVAKDAISATKTRTSGTKRVSAALWAEIEAIWVSGMMTRKTMAEKFGITERTIQRHMKEKKLERGSKAAEHRESVEKEIGRVQVDDASILATRIRDSKEEHFKMVSALGRLTFQEILSAKNNERPVATAMNNLKALETAIGNIKKVREEKWVILGLDKDTFIDEDGLPDLVISELTAEQVQELRGRNHIEFDDLPDSNIGEEIGEVVEEE